MSWRWISIAALLAAVVIGYGALTRRDTQPQPAASPPSQPGYYLKNAIITQTQADGSPGISLIAARIEQQPEDDSIVLDDVRVEYSRVPDKRWVLSAQRGFVPASSRVIQFAGDVQLRPADGGPESFLRAESLAIDTQNNLAYSTSSPVSMGFGRHALRVKGFEADLKSEKIKLESVNGRFAAQ